MIEKMITENISEAFSFLVTVSDIYETLRYDKIFPGNKTSDCLSKSLKIIVGFWIF